MVLGLLISLTVFCGDGRSSHAAAADEIVILFDQSGSMGRYDPKLVSKIWLMTFLRTFEAPHRAIFTGFDEKIREYIEVSTDQRPDMAELVRTLDGISTSGLATDLEAPFRLLLERGNLRSVKLALIVSDGEPEIWDGKLGYLSKAVRADRRYDDLNRAYDGLAAEGLNAAQLFDRLGARFHLRNIDLIEAHLPAIGKALGARLIIWDLSGRSYYLRNWARMAGAQYLPIRVAAHEKPVKQLRKALLHLQEKASEMVEETLPADHRAVVETVLSSVPETKQASPPEPTTPETAAAARPSPGLPTAAPRTGKGQPSQTDRDRQAEPASTRPRASPDSGTSGSLWWELVAAILGSVVVAGVFLARRIRRQAPEGQSFAPALATAGDRSGPQDAGVEVETDVSNFVDERVKQAMTEAEKLRRELLGRASAHMEIERRFSLRVSVPPGAIEVHWTNPDGQPGMGRGFNISMHGILFEAKGFKAKGIDRIVFPKQNTVMNVKHADISRREENKAAAVLHEFEKNVDNWMTWIQLLTRINEDA